KKRADLEYELNHGLHHEPSKMSWERFRELFEGEFLPAKRVNTRRNYTDTLDLFEELARPALLGKITERTLSLFIAEMRKRKTRGGAGMLASTTKVRLQFLHTVLAWAVEQKFLPRVPNFPSVKVPKRRPQPVPCEVFERLAERAADPNMKAYLFTAWLG